MKMSQPQSFPTSLLGSWRTGPKADYNAAAEQLAGPAGPSGERGILGEQLTGNGAQPGYNWNGIVPPYLGGVPSSGPFSGAEPGPLNTFRYGIINRIAEQNPEQAQRMIRNLLGQGVMPAGINQGAMPAGINPASLPGRGLL